MNSHETDPSAPVVWKELLEAELPKAVNGRDTAELLIGQMRSHMAPGRIYSTLIGLDRLLAHVSIVLGPDQAVTLLREIEPAIPLAVAFIPPRPAPAMRTGLLSLLSLTNVAACHGLRVALEPALAADWTAQLAKQTRGDVALPDVRACAFAAIASGQTSLLSDVIGRAPLSSTFEPGQRFGHNTQGFMCYLAQAVERDASYQDFEPAWADFLISFPRKLAAQTLHWGDLMWAVRLVSDRFCKNPTLQAATWLHNTVTS